MLCLGVSVSAHLTTQQPTENKSAPRLAHTRLWHTDPKATQTRLTRDSGLDTILNARQDSGKERAHKLKKNVWDTGRVSLEHPAGQTGVYRPVSQGFPVNYSRKTDRKGAIFAGTPAGCPRDTRPSRFFFFFPKFYVIFSYVPFSAP